MENDLLKKQMGWVEDILREENFNITIEATPPETRGYIADYTFNMINSNHASRRPYAVSSVVISIKEKVPILIPLNGAQTITRATEHTRHDLFHIEYVLTDELSRGNGYATLLLICGMSYLKNLEPYTYINFFTLNDESDRNTYIGENIYNKLGFLFMYDHSLSYGKKDTLDQTHTKKILNFNIETIEHWVDVLCLSLINDIRANLSMPLIDETIAGIIKKNKKTQKQKNTKTKKPKNTKTKKHKNKKHKNKKNTKPLKFKHFNSAPHQHK